MGRGGPGEGSTDRAGADLLGHRPGACGHPGARAVRWFGGGWKVNAELPGTSGFAGATQFVRPEDVADAIPCGPDFEGIVEAVGQFVEAGFTDVAVVQVGDEGQEEFLAFAEEELLPALRSR